LPVSWDRVAAYRFEAAAGRAAPDAFVRHSPLNATCVEHGYMEHVPAGTARCTEQHVIEYFLTVM
jgi:hypothetical protein